MYLEIHLQWWCRVFMNFIQLGFELRCCPLLQIKMFYHFDRSRMKFSNSNATYWVVIGSHGNLRQVSNNHYFEKAYRVSRFFFVFGRKEESRTHSNVWISLNETKMTEMMNVESNSFCMQFRRGIYRHHFNCSSIGSESESY